MKSIKYLISCINGQKNGQQTYQEEEKVRAHHFDSTRKWQRQFGTWKATSFGRRNLELPWVVKRSDLVGIEGDSITGLVHVVRCNRQSSQSARQRQKQERHRHRRFHLRYHQTWDFLLRKKSQIWDLLPWREDGSEQVTGFNEWVGGSRAMVCVWPTYYLTRSSIGQISSDILECIVGIEVNG